MMTPAHKVVVRLTDEQRPILQALVRSGTQAAYARTHAQILLRADADGPYAWPDERIAEALGVCRMTVAACGSSSPPKGSMRRCTKSGQPGGSTASSTGRKRPG